MKKHLSLATLIPAYDDQNIFWKSPTSGIQKASQEVNANGVEINNFSFDQFDPKNYIETFNKLIDTNPDAVVMAPIFIKETSIIIKLLNEKNIPFIFLNINQKGYNNLCYIGQNHFMHCRKLLNLCTFLMTSFIIQTRKP